MVRALRPPLWGGGCAGSGVAGAWWTISKVADLAGSETSFAPKAYAATEEPAAKLVAAGAGRPGTAPHGVIARHGGMVVGRVVTVPILQPLDVAVFDHAKPIIVRRSVTCLGAMAGNVDEETEVAHEYEVDGARSRRQKMLGNGVSMFSIVKFDPLGTLRHKEETTSNLEY